MKHENGIYEPFFTLFLTLFPRSYLQWFRSQFTLLTESTIIFVPSFINRWQTPSTKWLKLSPMIRCYGWRSSCWSTTIISQWSVKRVRKLCSTLWKWKIPVSLIGTMMMKDQESVAVIWRNSALWQQHQAPLAATKFIEKLPTVKIDKFVECNLCLKTCWSAWIAMLSNVFCTFCE